MRRTYAFSSPKAPDWWFSIVWTGWRVFEQKSADPQITIFLSVAPFLFVYLLLAINGPDVHGREV